MFSWPCRGGVLYESGSTSSPGKQLLETAPSCKGVENLFEFCASPSSFQSEAFSQGRCEH